MNRRCVFFHGAKQPAFCGEGGYMPCSGKMNLWRQGLFFSTTSDHRPTIFLRIIMVTGTCPSSMYSGGRGGIKRVI